LPTLASTHSIINPTPHPQSYTLSLHDALPISGATVALSGSSANPTTTSGARGEYTFRNVPNGTYKLTVTLVGFANGTRDNITVRDRKSTRLNSSHGSISYAVFCLKKKKNNIHT